MNSQSTEQKLPRQSFSRHLLKSHMSIAAIGTFAMLLSLVIIFFQTKNINILSRNSIPTATASSAALQGVQHSLASLRGWVSLNDERFVQDWHHVWEDEIKPFISQLEQRGPSMNLPGFNKKITELSLLLTDLEESQWWVVEIAQTPGNEPARVIYQFDIEPIMLNIHNIIRNIPEAVMRNTDSMATLQHGEINILLDTENSFHAARETLEKIVFQGKVELENQYRNNLQALQAAVSSLPQDLSANDRLNTMIFFFQKELVALDRLSTEVITIRKSNKWNIVRHLMVTETVPLAQKAIKVIDGLAREMDTLMIRHATIANRTGNYASLGASALFIIMILTAVVISRQRASALSRPVTALAVAANQLAMGKLTEDISLESDDELGDLIQSFNTMRKDLQTTQKKMIRHEKLAAIGKLAGSVAHDIRNPLGAINNSVYFLSRVVKQDSDDKILKHLTIMGREINHANNIVNDMLDFSRDNVPVFKEGNINLLLQEILAGYNFPDNISLDLQLDTDLPIILFDRSQQRRVIHNLINNAKQSMPDGGTVLLRTGHDDAFVWIKVSDTGLGIKEEDLDKIFEPLYTTKAKGVGLGLSIVNDFIEKHHGRVTVESMVGQGSTFTVSLPADAKELKNGCRNSASGFKQ